jgi:HK97 family phage portal protein
MNVILGPDGFPARAIGSSSAAEDWFWRDTPQLAGDKLERPYAQSGWVHACIMTVATAVASMPVRVMRGARGAAEPVESGPIFDLFESPGPEGQSAREFWQAVASWILMRGEAFLVGYDGASWITDKPRLPKHWDIAAPSSVKAVKESGRLRGWTVASTPPISIAHGAMVQPKEWNPYDADRGLGKLEVAMMEANLAYTGVRWNVAYLANGAHPGGIITVRGQVDDNAKKRLRAGWDDTHAGPAKAGRTRILDNGAEYEPLELSHREMQFLEVLQWSRDAICAIFGVPKSLLSVTDDINYATAVVQERALYERAAIPLARLIADSVNNYLWSAGAKEWMMFDWSSVEALQVRVNEKLDAAKKMIEIGYTRDEAAEYLDLDLPREDDIDSVEVGVQDTALNGAQVASLTDIVKAVVAGELPGESAVAMIQVAFPTLDESEAKSIIDPAVSLAEETPEQPVRLLRSSTSDRRRSLEEHQRAVIFPLESRVSRMFRTELMKQRRDLIRELRKTSRAIDDADIDGIIGRASSDWDASVRKAAQGPLAAVQKAAVKRVSEELGISFDLDPNDPRMLEIFGETVGMLIRANETTVAAAREVLIRGVGSSKPVAEIARELSTLPEFGLSRALTVARTETGMLTSGTRFVAFAEEGIDRKVWISSGDDIVRESHRDVDGEEQPLAEAFSNGLNHPHEIGAEPGEVINCRCEIGAA